MNTLTVHLEQRCSQFIFSSSNIIAPRGNRVPLTLQSLIRVHLSLSRSIYSLPFQVYYFIQLCMLRYKSCTIYDVRIPLAMTRFEVYIFMKNTQSPYDYFQRSNTRNVCSKSCRSYYIGSRYVERL